CGPKGYEENAREDKNNQGKKQFCAGLRRLLLCGLCSAHAHGVGKDTERMSDGCSKSLRLYQHDNKLPDELDIQSRSHAAPCIQARLTGTLLEADDLEFFR